MKPQEQASKLTEILALIPESPLSFERMMDMFENCRYETRGIAENLPFELRLLLWTLIDRMEVPKDYLQVFEISSWAIQHTQECPGYSRTYRSPVPLTFTGKVFVIDDGTHSTMLLAEEY